MKYKIIFSGTIDGKKHNLDTVIESKNVPTATSPEVLRATMRELSQLIEGDSSTANLVVTIEAILPI